MRITKLEEEFHKKETELADFEQCINGSNKWMQTFLHFLGAEELTREMAVELLEIVEVFGDKRIHIRFRSEYEYLMKQLEAEDQGQGGAHERAVCG